MISVFTQRTADVNDEGSDMINYAPDLYVAAHRKRSRILSRGADETVDGLGNYT